MATEKIDVLKNRELDGTFELTDTSDGIGELYSETPTSTWSEVS